jgi:outer membrane protein OmpU
MKKILLATSILAASAGFAAAEVTVSGAARMGLVYNGTDTLFSSRVRVSFGMTGTTDGGLEFGASVRNDQSGQGNTANGDSTVYISGAFGKLTMGDTGNAADALVGQVSGVGYTGLGDTNEIGFLATTKTGALYEYSTGGLTFALGSAQTNALVGDVVSLAVKYSTDAFSVALGYEDDTIGQQVSLLGSATFGAATVKLKLADRDTFADMAAALSVDYTTGAATITAFATDNVDFLGTDTLGLGVAYDLGGGAKMVGGVVDNGANTVADLGLTFSF